MDRTRSSAPRAPARVAARACVRGGSLALLVGGALAASIARAAPEPLDAAREGAAAPSSPAPASTAPAPQPSGAPADASPPAAPVVAPPLGAPAEASASASASAVAPSPEATAVAPSPGPPDAAADEPITEPEAPPLPPVAPRERAGVVIQTVLGLVAVLVLAYLGGQPRVQRWERRLGIAQVVTAGFPFVALGVLARLPAVGILSDPVLGALRPLLRIALGWIGFLIGFRFDARMLGELRPGTAAFVAWRAAITFAAIIAAASLVWAGTGWVSPSAWKDPSFVRLAIILATAGALTSLQIPRLLEARGGSPDSVELVSGVVRVEEAVGVVGLLGIAAYFRGSPGEVAWQLPGTAWVLLTLGLGVTIGLLAYAILVRSIATAAESLVLILGSIAFAAGLAGQLRLSPVVVCFVAGLLLANFPGAYKPRLAETLASLERPIYLLFLVVVGALWEVTERGEWTLMVAFVVARIVGKWLGTRVGAATAQLPLARDARKALIVAPMGALSIAIVVNASMLYPHVWASALVTAVVGGAIVTEVIVQLSGGPSRVAESASAPRARGER